MSIILSYTNLVNYYFNVALLSRLWHTNGMTTPDKFFWEFLLPVIAMGLFLYGVSGIGPGSEE